MNWRDHTDRVIRAARDTFGEQIEYTPRGDTPVTITGVFDNEYQAVNPDTGAVITSQQPVLSVRLADLTLKPKNLDEVLRNSVRYKVIDVQDDGYGMARLFLHTI